MTKWRMGCVTLSLLIEHSRKRRDHNVKYMNKNIFIWLFFLNAETQLYNNFIRESKLNLKQLLTRRGIAKLDWYWILTKKQDDD